MIQLAWSVLLYLQVLLANESVDFTNVRVCFTVVLVAQYLLSCFHELGLIGFFSSLGPVEGGYCDNCDGAYNNNGCHFLSSFLLSWCLIIIGGEDVEILIIDDGSTKDRTAEIADEYEAQFPTIVRAIHKENGGHGSAVNTGIANAKGLYFKVVDSDDWVKQDAYFKILDTLRELAGGGQALDMLISNYVYEKEGERRKKVIQYRHILPVERMFTWKDCHHFIKGHYILMHSVIFRTKLLQECGLKLPEHTFYVDNLYVFEPLPYVKNMYYLDVNFYRYYIGRQDQSVNETVMISRIDQQIRVTKLMIDYLVAKKQELVKNRRLYQYMRNYLEIIMTVSSVLLIRSGMQEHLDKKKELWEYLKSKDKRLYLWMRNGIMGGTMNLPGKGGRKISVEGYKICQKLFGFN